MKDIVQVEKQLIAWLEEQNQCCVPVSLASFVEKQGTELHLPVQSPVIAKPHFLIFLFLT